MHRKLIVGWILFIVGVLLQAVSDMVDLWIVGVLGGIIWPVGTVIGVNASISIDCKRQQKKNSGEDTNSSELGNE